MQALEPIDATARARLLAVEVLLGEPELLGNDALEVDLYALRDNLSHHPTAAVDGLLAAFTLPGVPESVGVARRRVRAALTSRAREDLADAAELIVSEFTTNALQYAGGLVDVVLITAGGVLMIIAADSSRVPPVMSKTGDGESGRGLVIVDEVADRWGWWQSSTGKSVWAAIRFV